MDDAGAGTVARGLEASRSREVPEGADGAGVRD